MRWLDRLFRHNGAVNLAPEVKEAAELQAKQLKEWRAVRDDITSEIHRVQQIAHGDSPRARH